jgi:hypothetical protein
MRLPKISLVVSGGENLILHELCSLSHFKSTAFSAKVQKKMKLLYEFSFEAQRLLGYVSLNLLLAPVE